MGANRDGSGTLGVWLWRFLSSCSQRTTAMLAGRESPHGPALSEPGPTLMMMLDEVPRHNPISAGVSRR